MGQPKALLRVEGVSFIENIVTALRSSKVGEIVVVLGHNADQLRSKISHLPVTVIINREYKEGQLSSLAAALRFLESKENVDGILLHLVDHPFLSPALVDLMIDRFYESKKLIIVPRHQGKRGHPVIFARSLFPELLAAPANLGAKTVVNAHRKDALEIDTENEGVTIDIDTPEEYRRHVRGD
jgi:molybdenum cofactor cytidylyltransferase